MPSLILAFLAGVLTIASPCVLPILPVMLAGSIGNKLRPITIVIGMSITFTLMGGLFSVIGLALGSFNKYLRTFSIFVIIAMGILLLDEELNQKFARITSIFINKIGGFMSFRKKKSEEHFPERKEGFLGAFILGLSLGIIWIPCVGPILGSILAFVTVEGNVLHGSFLLFIYSLGLGIPMIAIAYSGKLTSKKIATFAEHGELLKKFAGLVLILAGLSMFFGIDRWLQKVLLPYFPPLI